MKMTKQILSICTVLGLMLLGMTSYAQAQTNFHAQLSGENEVPPVTTDATGLITATLTGDQLTIEGSFENLSSDYSASHIHTGAAGENGGVLTALTADVSTDNRSATYTAASNTFTLTSEQIDLLNQKGLYINVHTANFGSGELRGQLIENIDIEFAANLSGSNEVPSIITSAGGSVTATLNGNQLVIEGSFENLSGDYAASHIHSGMAGQNGGVVVALSPTVNADNKSGTFAAASNTFELTAEQMTTLENQGMYINIHSSTFAGGELRGQLVQSADAYFRTNLSGAYEMPAVKTMAYGGLVFQLKGDTLIASGSFANLSGEFDAEIAGGSHLHMAEAGSNGSVMISLNATLSEDKLSGTYLPENNRFEVTTEQKTALMSRKMYVNIHTKAFGSGELRGQVTPPVTAAFYATLSGSAEVPSVKTEASGAVLAEIQGDSLILSGSFANLSSDFDAEVAGGSHLHNAHAGTNGGVDFILNADVAADLRSGSYMASDNAFELTAEQKAEMMARNYYLNIHTENFGAGELRGQLLAEATAYFKTTLSGVNEVQPIVTNAMGKLNVEVNGNIATVVGGYTGLSGAIDTGIAGGAHLHDGSVAANGDVSVLINTTIEQDTAGTYTAAMNTIELTEEQLATLYAEGLYANIHSTAFASGELRGQLLFGDNMFPGSSEITSPEEGAMLSITGSATTMFEATWTEATDENEIAYIWQLATDSAFTNIIVNANVGAETSFMADFATLDGILADLGVAIGATATVYHRVLVSDGSDQTASEPRSANLERGQVVSNEEENLGTVESFELEQNYPNPFNPSTNIAFSLAEAGNATIKVYNLIGQEVATIANERFSAGSHTVQFDASSLASGAYIYRLTSGANTITKRMTLIK